MLSPRMAGSEQVGQNSEVAEGTAVEEGLVYVGLSACAFQNLPLKAEAFGDCYLTPF